jgi:hypothetical protein
VAAKSQMYGLRMMANENSTKLGVEAGEDRVNRHARPYCDLRLDARPTTLMTGFEAA